MESTKNITVYSKICKLTFSLPEAADFLNISTGEMKLLTARGHIKRYKDSKKEYYLAGALDEIKPRVEQLLKEEPSVQYKD